MGRGWFVFTSGGMVRRVCLRAHGGLLDARKSLRYFIVLLDEAQNLDLPSAWQLYERFSKNLVCTLANDWWQDVLCGGLLSQTDLGGVLLQQRYRMLERLVFNLRLVKRLPQRFDLGSNLDMVCIASSKADEVPLQPLDGNLVGLLLGLDGRELVLSDR